MFTDETAVPAPAIDTDADLLTDFKAAVDDGELNLCYQPLVRSGDGEIIGFEALLRWSSERWGDVSPGRFVPLAEEARLMPKVGQWVIATGARQLSEWQRVGLVHNRRLHVNLTLQELLEPNLPGFAARALSRAEMQPEQLCFEVTERDLRAGGDAAADAVEAMAAAGFRPVLDNFGVDSSVEILTRHPFEFAKIDHNLIYGPKRSRHWARLLRGIGGLARSLNITLIVEGVESQEEMTRVAALGFAVAQGYAFGRPDTAGNLGRTLAENRSWAAAKT